MCLLEGWRSQQLNVSDEANTSFAHYRGEVGMLHRLVGRDPLLMICNSAESKPRKSKGKCPIQRRQQRQRPLKNTRNCNLTPRCKNWGRQWSFFHEATRKASFFIYISPHSHNQPYRRHLSSRSKASCVSKCWLSLDTNEFQLR